MSRITPLFLSLSHADPRPVTKQIVDGIRVAIASGELPVGANLPSVRGLASQLAVNPKTIAKAYEQLAADGWLLARPGFGVLVAAPRQRLAEAERERLLAAALEAFSADVVGLGFPVERIVDDVRSRLTPMLGRWVA